MNFFVVFGFFFATALAASKNFQVSPVSLKNIQNRIVHGQDAIKGQIPFQVGLQCLQFPHGSWFCGGSLISEQWVVTTASCAVGIVRFLMWFGGITTSADEVDRLTIESREFYVHEGYNSNLNNNIALIKLPEPLEFSDLISPVRLPARGEVIGDNQLVQISGWGKTSDDAGINTVLKYALVTTISNEECADIYGSSVVTESTLCTVGHPGNSTCDGDTGGPLVNFDEDGVATLHGIISFVSNYGCNLQYPSGYVRTESMLDWIAERTGLVI